MGFGPGHELSWTVIESVELVRRLDSVFFTGTRGSERRQRTFRMTIESPKLRRIHLIDVELL